MKVVMNVDFSIRLDIRGFMIPWRERRIIKEKKWAKKCHIQLILMKLIYYEALLLLKKKIIVLWYYLIEAQRGRLFSPNWYNFTFYRHIILLTGSILWQSGIKDQQNFVLVSVVLPNNHYLNMKVSTWKTSNISNICSKFHNSIEMICLVRHCRPLDRRCGRWWGLPQARLPQGRLPRCLPQDLRLRKTTFTSLPINTSNPVIYYHL